MLPRFLRSALDSAPSLPSSSLRHFFPCLSYYLSFSLCFILCHSSSLSSYLVLSTFLTLSFSLFHFSSFISVPSSFSLSFCYLFVPIVLYPSLPLSCISLSRARSLLFISVALMILLPSWRFRKSSLLATVRSIPQPFVFFENLKSFCEIQ